MPSHNFILGKNITVEKLNRAKELRRGMTAAEEVLWQHLRKNQLCGFHFRRQQIIGGLIVDFYCHRVGVVLELDGEIHGTEQEYDIERDKILTGLGLVVIRFHNDEVFNRLDEVLQRIRPAVCS